MENPAFCISHFFFWRRAPQVGLCTIQWVPCTIQWVPCTVYMTYKHLFSTKFLLKMGLTALFTHLKIILLQYFLFSVFNNKQYSNKFLEHLQQILYLYFLEKKAHYSHFIYAPTDSSFLFFRLVLLRCFSTNKEHCNFYYSFFKCFFLL